VDNLWIGEVRQQLELVSLLGFVGVVDAEVLDVPLLEFLWQAVHDVGSVAGIAHVTVGVDVAKMDGTLVHHGHAGASSNLSAGAPTEFTLDSGSLPHGEVGGTHDTAVLEVYHHPGAATRHKGIVLLVKKLVAAGKLESGGSLLPGPHGKGVVCLGVAMDSQAHTGNQDGDAAVLQHIVGHAPLVVVLHGSVGGGQQQL